MTCCLCLLSYDPVLPLVLSLTNGIEHYRITVGSGSKEMERYVQQCNIRKWAWHTFDWIKTKSPVHKAQNSKVLRTNAQTQNEVTCSMVLPWFYVGRLHKVSNE